MKFIKIFLGMLLIQTIFLTTIFIGITVIRFFDSNSFNEIIESYSKYALYDLSTSIVYEGK
jgi:hypothetical protein